MFFFFSQADLAGKEAAHKRLQAHCQAERKVVFLVLVPAPILLQCHGSISPLLRQALTLDSLQGDSGKNNKKKSWGGQTKPMLRCFP